MKVAALVDGWDKGEPTPKGHIVDVLGMPGENDTEMHAILAEYALPYRFEPEVENAADQISDQITERDLKGRRDFRNTLTFTIDPTDAKDFDDALSLQETGQRQLRDRSPHRRRVLLCASRDDRGQGGTGARNVGLSG